MRFQNSNAPAGLLYAWCFLPGPRKTGHIRYSTPANFLDWPEVSTHTWVRLISLHLGIIKANYFKWQQFKVMVFNCLSENIGKEIKKWCSDANRIIYFSHFCPYYIDIPVLSMQVIIITSIFSPNWLFFRSYSNRLEKWTNHKKSAGLMRYL